MQNRTRGEQLIIRVTPKEKAIIQIKMKQMHTNCFSRYARKMLIDGMVFNVDLEKFHELAMEVQKVGVNINQIARIANTNGAINHSEIKKAGEQMDEIWQLLKSFLSTLLSINQ